MAWVCHSPAALSGPEPKAPGFAWGYLLPDGGIADAGRLKSFRGRTRHSLRPRQEKPTDSEQTEPARCGIVDFRVSLLTTLFALSSQIAPRLNSVHSTAAIRSRKFRAWRNRRLQPKTAFSRLPPVHRAGSQKAAQGRAELLPARIGTTGICALLTFRTTPCASLLLRYHSAKEWLVI